MITYISNNKDLKLGDVVSVVNGQLEKCYYKTKYDNNTENIAGIITNIYGNEFTVELSGGLVNIDKAVAIGDKLTISPESGKLIPIKYLQNYSQFGLPIIGEVKEIFNDLGKVRIEQTEDSLANKPKLQMKLVDEVYRALRNIYIGRLQDKVVETINIFPDIGDLSIDWQNANNWAIDDTQKLDNKYTVRKGTNQWSGLHCAINYKKPGQYKFTAYIKSSVDDEPLMLYGVGRTSDNKQLNRAFTSKKEWQQIEFVFNKSDITTPDYIRLEKTKKTDTILYISKYELTPVGEIEKLANEPKKITINSLNLLDNTQFSETLSRDFVSITNGEITSKELSSWFGMTLVSNQTLLLKKDKTYQFSFDIKGTVNTDDFNKAVFINKAKSSEAIETTLNKLVTTYTLSTEYQRYIYYTTPKADVETNQIFIQHNGNKTTTNQFIVRNLMLSEVTSDWDDAYFKKEFTITKFEDSDPGFKALIDELIYLDSTNTKYIISA